jgi:hypothetical protein
MTAPKVAKKVKVAAPAGVATKVENAAVQQASQRADDLAAAQELVRQRAAARQAPLREATRVGARGNITVEGRGGEILTRKRTGTSDPFDIDQNIVPKGWAYQWNAISVVGNQEILMDQNLALSENGWRPVPASRHPGRYMPHGHNGAIIRGQCRLEERPAVLNEEARNEDLRKAAQLISDRNDSLKLTSVKKQLGEGFEMSRQYRGTGGDIRMQIDHGADIPKPSHTLAEPGE